MGALESLFARIEARVSGPYDHDLRLELAELREDLNITPTFLERRREAQVEVQATVDEFQRVAALYAESSGSPWRAMWRDHLQGEYRPQMTRALQDLMGAQIREHIELVIPQLRTLRAALVGLRAQRGDYS